MQVYLDAVEGLEGEINDIMRKCYVLSACPWNKALLDEIVFRYNRFLNAYTGLLQIIKNESIRFSSYENLTIIRKINDVNTTSNKVRGVLENFAN